MIDPLPLAEFAPAKVNLTLNVLGRRGDGYHEIESLVVFADVGDRLQLNPSAALDFSVTGPTAAAAGPVDDNLVLKAARELAKRMPALKVGRFRLAKRIPVAAGIGGGSSDAAAALRLLARLNHLPLAERHVAEAAQATGADVPVCLDPQARMMRGIGERLSAPLDLPVLPALLVNPGVPIATRDVFRSLKVRERSASDDPPRSLGRAALQDYIASRGNDLEAPALVLQPVIRDVLVALRALPGCELAQMSGSGATCFGLFASQRAAAVAARHLRSARPTWWIKAVSLR